MINIFTRNKRYKKMAEAHHKLRERIRHNILELAEAIECKRFKDEKADNYYNGIIKENFNTLKETDLGNI